MMDHGYAECGCIPGHRSTHQTHACIDCGLPDSDVEDGRPIPLCTAGLMALALATGCTPAPVPPPHDENVPHHVGQPDDPDAPETDNGR